LPALSLAWGLWDTSSGMAGDLADADRRRLDRSGARALAEDEALALFDAAAALDRPAVVPIGLVPKALEALGVGEVPALLRGIVRTRSRRAAGSGPAGEAGLRAKIAGRSAADRAATLLDTVRAQAAVILGHSSAAEIDPDRSFKELGFDSLGAVEFRNTLNALTGLRLPSTLVFEFPDARALAEYLAAELAPATDARDRAEEARVREILRSVPFERLRAAGLMDTLLALSADKQAPAAPPLEAAAGPAIDDLDTDALISMALGDDA
ncbi:beta-ketoacyl reductase, partial [Streptomyces sp. NPDC054786]